VREKIERETSGKATGRGQRESESKSEGGSGSEGGGGDEGGADRGTLSGDSAGETKARRLKTWALESEKGQSTEESSPLNPLLTLRPLSLLQRSPQKPLPLLQPNPPIPLILLQTSPQRLRQGGLVRDAAAVGAVTRAVATVAAALPPALAPAPAPAPPAEGRQQHQHQHQHQRQQGRAVPTEGARAAAAAAVVAPGGQQEGLGLPDTPPSKFKTSPLLISVPPAVLPWAIPRGGGESEEGEGCSWGCLGLGQRAVDAGGATGCAGGSTEAVPACGYLCCGHCELSPPAP